HAKGDMIIVRYADDQIVGFQHRSDAERFLNDLRERLAAFALSLHPEKTRLIEFGRYAAERRAGRGLGKPETFDFLGLTHYCSTEKDGTGFQLGRKTQRKRMRTKLREIKETLRRRRHVPIDEQGQYLGAVLRGHFAYFAVPTNTRLLSAFRYNISIIVINVSWADAKGYVAWLSNKTSKRYRLLTETEREYVTRAGTTSRFWWGEHIGEGLANCDGCGSQWDKRQTAPVGSFNANGFGLFDVHGNVWEWIEDCDFDVALADNSGMTCSSRVLQGGAWTSNPNQLRAAARIRSAP